MAKALCAPGTYLQGKGEMGRLATYAGTLDAHRAYLIVSPFNARTYHDLIVGSFEETAIEHTISVFGGECSQAEIDRHGSALEGADIVFGIGGGKTLDTAKAVAHFAGLPVIIVPTAASTDAPTSRLSVIYHEDGSFDRYLPLPKNPDMVVIDTDVIAHAPARFLMAGIGDALATYYEAAACQRSNAITMSGHRSTLGGMALAKLCYQTLRDYGSQAIAACENHVVTPALDAIIEANVYLSGVGADNVNCAAAHSFYNGLTALGGHSAPHGCCVAFGTLVQLTLEGATKEEFYDVQGFCREVGLPTTLAELGVMTDEQIHVIAENACVEGETIHNLAGDVTPDELYAAIVATNALGWKGEK